MRRGEGRAVLVELRNEGARGVTPPEEMRPWEARIFHAAHDSVRDRYGRGNWGTRSQTMSEIWERALADGVVEQSELELVRYHCGDLWHQRGPDQVERLA